MNKRILTVCSTLDFVNYTRRATIEEIWKQHQQTDILLYNSLKNYFKPKNIIKGPAFYFYHFLVPESLKRYALWSGFEYFLRKWYWKRLFSKYEVIFFTDPNQYYLLPYTNESHKIIYLIRDPSILLDKGNYAKELPIIRRANAILAVSHHLVSYYFEKYYGFVPVNVHYWPNTVDLALWDIKKWEQERRPHQRPVAGFAGNINYVIDLDLISYLASKNPQIDFEMAGKIACSAEEQQKLDKLLALPNVKHLGFIPFNQFPSVVINWDIGLVVAKTNHEFGRYLNNNKQFQYLALGKPFVTFRYDADYEEFGDLVFVASSKEEYSQMLTRALNKAIDPPTLNLALSIASKNSALSRANQFVEIVNNLVE